MEPLQEHPKGMNGLLAAIAPKAGACAFMPVGAARVLLLHLLLHIAAAEIFGNGVRHVRYQFLMRVVIALHAEGHFITVSYLYL